jgi:hypothetical protein
MYRQKNNSKNKIRTSHGGCIFVNALAMFCHTEAMAGSENHCCKAKLKLKHDKHNLEQK